MPEIGQSREAGGLLKTGQITQYAGYLDDGYYRKGILKVFTLHTEGQYAGITDITLNAKTDAHTNNCVYDQVTKLMWSRDASKIVGTEDNGTLPWTTNENGEGIFPYAAAANAAKLAGYSDWRIPNLNELLSLVDIAGPYCAPDPTYFPNWTELVQIFTSSTHPLADTVAFAVYFGFGGAIFPAKTDKGHVALVRG